MPKTKAALPILSECLCHKCVGLCCNYITIRIDAPTNKRERDDIRWYLLHEGITILITDEDWQVKVPTRCEKLGSQNECTIYETRPQTCRDYSTDSCDYHSVFLNWDTDYKEIETVEAFDLYLDKQAKSKKRKSTVKSASKNGKKVKS